MAIVTRYFEVVGEALEQLESLLDERIQRRNEANEFAQAHGFAGVAIQNTRNHEYVRGFVMEDDETPDEKAWRVCDKTLDNERIWYPRKTAKKRRELAKVINNLPLVPRSRLLAVFGLESWEVMEPAGHSLRLMGSAIGKVAGRWIVVVPEPELPAEDDDQSTFPGHECLREITLAQYQQYQADHEAEKEAA